MKLKIEIKNRFTRKILFEYEAEDNSIKKTVTEAVKNKADLHGSDLQGSDLRGADLQGVKIKTAAVFTGLYTYMVIPYITEKNETRIKMGCFDRTVKEWEDDFWNNNNEFPNNGSMKSNQRLLAFETAKKWLELAEKHLETEPQ